MHIIATYFTGVVIGMLVMSAILKSRVFYHLNTLDWFTAFKRREKLKWML
jgi:hypothetical protein